MRVIAGRCAVVRYFRVSGAGVLGRTPMITLALAGRYNSRLMPKEAAPEDAPRLERDVRSSSEFLRGQMREWMQQVVTSGRTSELFELEMWLRSFERFFRI